MTPTPRSTAYALHAVADALTHAGQAIAAVNICDKGHMPTWPDAPTGPREVYGLQRQLDQWGDALARCACNHGTPTMQIGRIIAELHTLPTLAEAYGRWGNETDRAALDAQCGRVARYCSQVITGEETEYLRQLWQV